MPKGIPNEKPFESEDLKSLQAKVAELEEKNAELEEQGRSAKENLVALEKALKSAHSVAKGVVEAKLHSWEGVDYSKPAYAIKMTMRTVDGVTVPAEGDIVISFEKSPDGTPVRNNVVLKFKDGRCVTNDLEAARRCSSFGRGFCITEVK